MKQEKIFLVDDEVVFPETVGDMFDALISERPYKKKWPVENSVQELKNNSGIHFDPVLGFDWKWFPFLGAEGYVQGTAGWPSKVFLI